MHLKRRVVATRDVVMVTKRIISIGWWPTYIHSDQQYPNFSKLVPKDYYGQPHAGAGATNLSIYLSQKRKTPKRFCFRQQSVVQCTLINIYIIPHHKYSRK